MTTLILPGYSLKNKDWAEETKRQLVLELPKKSCLFRATRESSFSRSQSGIRGTLVRVAYWSHWETGQTEDNWVEKETDKIINNLQSERVNLLAKSIGTMVAMVVLRRKPEMVNKLILCGIPINDFLPGNEKYYEVLRDFPAENILCIQNKDDNHGSYDGVEKFVHSINPAIKIISKDRADHEYPYSEDFIVF